MAYQGKDYFDQEKSYDKKGFMQFIERRGDGVLSLKDIVDYAVEKANGGYNLPTSNPDNPKDPIRYLERLNLRLSKKDIQMLRKANISDAKVYTPEALEQIIAFKNGFDDRGWTIKGFNVDYETGAALNAVVQTGSGNGQAQISMVSYNVSHLGSGVINGVGYYHDKRDVWSISKGQYKLKAAGSHVNKVLSSLDFVLSDTDKVALIDTTDRGTHQAVRLFDPEARPSKRGEKNAYQRLMDDFTRVKGEDAEAVLQDIKGSEYHSANDGVMYIQIPRERQGNAPELEQAPLKDHFNTQVRPTSLRQLVEETYRLAHEDTDKDRAFQKDVLNRLPEASDLVDPETGLMQLELIDFDVVKRYAPDNALVMDLLAREQEFYLNEGYTVDQFRAKMLNNASDLARKIANDQDVEINRRILADVLASTDNGSRDVSSGEDLNDEFDDAIEDDMEALGSSSANLSTRQYLLNLMPGTVYREGDKAGEPHVGFLPEEEYSQWHHRALEMVQKSAEQSGVTHFEGKYDNDGVLYWTGQRGGERLSHKMGQFFFPNETPFTDPETGLTVPEGVIPVQKPGGAPDYRVNLYEMYFVSPKESHVRSKDGQRSYYNDNVVSRMRLKGFEQSLQEEVARTVKAQVLFANNDQDLFDASRMRSIYTNRTQPVTLEAANRAEVIRHLSHQVKMDKSMLDRVDYLNLQEGSQKHGIEERRLANARYLMTQPEMAGIVSMVSSSDGGAYGLKMSLTNEMIDYLDQFGDDPSVDFHRTGKIGLPGRDVGEGPDDLGPERVLQREFLNVPEARRAEILERYASLLPENPTDEEIRSFYKAPVEQLLADHAYGDYDASDRQGQVLNLYINAKDMIGGDLDPQGRPAPRTAFYSLAGSGIEDGRVVSRRWADEHGLMLEDKLSDLHNNKGTIGYITGKDPEDPDYNETIETFFKAQEDAGIELDMVISPHSPVSRHNMGVVREMVESDSKIPLVDPETGEPLTDLDGHPVLSAPYMTIVTPHMADKKNKHYGIQNNTKDRHISNQMNYALEANDAIGVFEEFHGSKDMKLMEAEYYFNALGLHTDPETNALLSGYPAMVDDQLTLDGRPITYSHPKEGEVLAVHPDEMMVPTQEGAEYLYPEDFAYIEIPVAMDEMVPRGENQQSIQSHYVPILPARYRRGTQSFDGEFREHDYNRQMDRILADSQEVESKQLDYLKRVMPHGLEAFGVQSPEDIDRLYQDKNPDFMAYKAHHSYEHSAEGYSEAERIDLKVSMAKLTNSVQGYRGSIANDKFGIDLDSAKHSFLNRQVVCDDVPDASTLVISCNTAQDLNTISISPLTAYNTGLVTISDPEAKEAMERAVAQDDIRAMSEALKGKTADGKAKYEPTYDPQEPPRVLIWRDPTIQGSSVVGVDFVISEERNGIGLNPATIGGTGADFDGDTMALVYPKSEASQKELKTGKLAVENKLRNVRLEEYTDPETGESRIRTQRDTIDGTDVAVTFGQSEEAEALRKKYPDANAKQLVGHYLDDMEQTANAQQALAQDIFFGKMKVSEADQKRYYNLAAMRTNDRLPELTPDEKRLMLVGDRVTEEAQKVGNKQFAKAYNQFADRFISDKNGEFKGRTIDFTSMDTALDSITKMVENGEKGKTPDIEINRHYGRDGVGIYDKRQQNIALAAKSDDVGKGGARLKDAALMAQALPKNQELYMADCTTLTPKGQPTQGHQKRPLMKTTTPMEMVMIETQEGTQAVLSIKKNAAEVPVAENYLKNHNHYIIGPYAGSDPSKPRYTQIDGKAMKDKGLTFESLVPKEGQFLLNARERESMRQTARGLDQYMAKHPDRDVYLDLNGGHITDNPSKKGPRHLNVKQHSHNVYTLGMMANAKLGGVETTYAEARQFYNQTREVGGYQAEDSRMLNAEENKFDKARPYDYIAQQGVKGLVDIAAHNEQHKYDPQAQKSFGKSGNAFETAICVKDKDKVFGQMAERRKGEIERFNNQRQAKEEAQEKLAEALEQQSQKDLSVFMDQAKALEIDFEAELDDLKDLDAELKAADVDRQRAETTVAINREELGEIHYLDRADTERGRGGDGPQMDAVNQERAEKLVHQPFEHGDVAQARKKSSLLEKVAKGVNKESKSAQKDAPEEVELDLGF